jgi:hypothetical protein
VRRPKVAKERSQQPEWKVGLGTYCRKRTPKRSSIGEKVRWERHVQHSIARTLGRSTIWRVIRVSDRRRGGLHVEPVVKAKFRRRELFPSGGQSIFEEGLQTSIGVVIGHSEKGGVQDE